MKALGSSVPMRATPWTWRPLFFHFKNFAMPQPKEKLEQQTYIIRLPYNPNTGNFFIDFVRPQDGAILISVKISEAVALGLGGHLGIKIMNG